MLSKVKQFCGNKKAQLTAATIGAFALIVSPSFAAESPTTGVDYVANLVTPIKDELKLAIVAGLALMVVIIAVRVGTRMIRSFGR